MSKQTRILRYRDPQNRREPLVNAVDLIYHLQPVILRLAISITRLVRATTTRTRPGLRARAKHHYQASRTHYRKILTSTSSPRSVKPPTTSLPNGSLPPLLPPLGGARYAAKTSSFSSVGSDGRSRRRSSSKSCC